MPRRRALLGLGLGAAALAGCGFRPRDPLSLPFKRLALVGFDPRSPLGVELRRRLTGLATVVDAPAEAEVVLKALEDRRRRVVAVSTPSAQVREIELHLRLVVRADTPGGKVLIPPITLSRDQDLSYDEKAALAKALEEESLFADMQTDVVSQLLRRLSAVEL